MSKKNILLLVGGGTKSSAPFIEAGQKLGVDVDVSSFAKLSFVTEGRSIRVLANGIDLAEYKVLYIRVVGKRFEDAALAVYYCRQNNVRIVDSMYEKDGLIRVPIPKSIETKLLYDAGIPMPKTYFGRMKMIKSIAPKLFGYPFVIKGTTGKQGHAVWSPKDEQELDKLVEEFTPLERAGKARFMAQEFVEASQRSRIFVIGEKAVAGITRPTRWRKRFLEKVNGEYPEGKREMLDPMDKEEATLAVAAAKAAGVDVGGADVITEDKTGKKYVLEVNSAPRWAALKKDTGIFVEEEILKYLAKL